MDKEDVAHTHTHTVEYYSAIKKNEILPFAMTFLELECLLSEISQLEKEKYHTISLICGIYKMKHMNMGKKTNHKTTQL